MWNGFSEPKGFRQTKDAVSLIILYSPFSVEGRSDVDCLRKVLIRNLGGLRARKSLRSGLCHIYITRACTSPWKKPCTEPEKPVTPTFSLVSDKWSLEHGVVALLSTRAVKSALLVNL